MSKRIRVSQLSMPIRHNMEDLYEQACKSAGIQSKYVNRFEVVKQSIDARKKPKLTYSYTIDLIVGDKTRYRKSRFVTEAKRIAYHPAISGDTPLQHPIVIVGSGPAGLFCAYQLAKYGYRPILLERGKDVDSRTQDVEAFWEDGTLNPESNVQFGEGGAGTFSDGKLNTQVKDKYGRNHYVLDTFVRFGAPEDIIYSGKPHIGTDVLRDVIKNMRNAICDMGGKVLFSTKMTDLHMDHSGILKIQVNHDEWLSVGALVLAIGHSARDTFELLYQKNLDMCAKSFAVGFRVEHPQEAINENQYGVGYDKDVLSAAPYKVTYQAQNGRHVFSFCMCPGGYVVNASSEPGRLAVNGMSYRDRGSANANSAIIVSVTPEDFPEGVLSGLAYQRKLEETAYGLANGKIPQQLFGDFERDSHTESYGEYMSCTKGNTGFSNLRPLFTKDMADAFIDGMHDFARKIKGFDRADAILSGIESRTSSPVRINRDDDFESNIKGIYPCGEGAGYAGGITSAAMDGLKVAEAIMKKYKPNENSQVNYGD